MRIFPTALVALLFGALNAASAASLANAASGASIIGSWSGRGTVRLASGQVEPVSCKVSYTKGGGGGKTLVLNAKCAAAGGTFKMYGRVSQRGASVYRGTLFNEQSTVSGKIDITVSGNSQTARVSNARGTGNVTLRRR